MIIRPTLWAGSIQDHHLAMSVQEPSALQIQAFSDTEDVDPIELETFGDYSYMGQLVGDLAIISVEGILVESEQWYNRYAGVVSYAEIQNAITNVVNAGTARNILMYVKTPGGAVTALKETTDFISKIDDENVPIYAYTPSSMNSGGMWLGSGARERFAAEMSQVGHVGVIAVHSEYSEYFKKIGIGHTILSRGKYKAVGSPYKKPSAADIAFMEQDLQVSYDFFIDALTENLGLDRDFVQNDIAIGKAFWASEALELGLIDAISTFEEVVSLLQEEDNASPLPDLSILNSQKGTNAMTIRRKKVVTPTSQALAAAGAPEVEVQSAMAVETEVETPKVKAESSPTSVETEVETPKVKAESSPTSVETDDNEGEVTAALASTASDMSILLDRLGAVQGENAILKAEATASKVNAELQTVQVASMKTALAQAVSNLAVALGEASQSYDDTSPEALVEMYTSKRESLMSSMKVGSTAEVPTDEDQLIEPSVGTVKAAAAAKI